MNSWLRFPQRRVQPAEPQPAVANGNGVVPALRPRSESAPSAQPRRRPLLLRPVALVGIALVLVALLGYLSAYMRASGRSPVLVAARNLPAGTRLTAADFTTGEIAGDPALVSSLVAGEQLDAVAGRRLSVSVPAGAPLPRAALGTRAKTPASFTLAVPALHALGGALAPGDRVTVLATFENGAGQAETKAIARGLQVLSVGRAESGLEGSAAIPVTVALSDPSVASALALANSDAKIDLLREGGSGGGAPIPPVRESAP